MKGIMAISAAALLIIGIHSGTSYGMLQGLDDDQTKEAVLYGKRSVKTDTLDFIREWSIVSEKPSAMAFLISEFLALASASRDAALRSLELNKFDIEDTLAKSSGKLVFRVSVFGPVQDFSQNYTAVVKAGSKEIPTSYWINGDGEPWGDGKNQPAFVSDNDYYFPAEGIDPKGKITLVVLDGSAKPVVSFNFDLSKLR